MKKLGRSALSLATAAALSMVTVFSSGQTMLTEAATTDASGKIYLSDEDIRSLTSETDYTFTRNAVHDPSVVDGRNGYYYVFGSHMGVSKTSDFMNWTSVTGETTSSTLFGCVNEDGSVSATSYNQAFRNNQTTKVTVLADGVETEVDFGSFDASAWNTAKDGYQVSGNMWAPDVVYNESMGKWCMYLSLNGSKWNSVIILLTADDVEGPYVYQGPVVYSGFSASVENCSYENSDLELVLGDLDSLPEKYNKADNGTWGDYWPHAIDPCVFFDANGELWMAYGSWSGGIYMLELDETTGLRDYTVNYESDYDSLGKNVSTDAYFGKKIAGGYYVSGEGSYICRIGNYYYLFLSYGFYSPEGGYNMRIFRSENPDGPYTDTAGTSSVYDRFRLNYQADWGNVADCRGEKLMANYQWNTMQTAEVSQGHNSAIVDSEGRAYAVYHTKYNDGTVGHSLRVHELFMNQNGWLVASPYEFTNDSRLNYNEAYDISELTGDYDVIVHSYKLGYDSNSANNIGVATPVSLSLNSDGTVSGAYSGTWSEAAGTPYATLTLDGQTYTGVFVRQTIDTTGMETMCFSVVDEATGLTVWGSKNMGDAAIVALNVTTADVAVPSKAFTDIELPTNGVQGATISWTSDHEAVLSSQGKISAVSEPTAVTLTKTVSKGNYIYQKDYTVTVMPPQTGEKILLSSYFTEGAVDLSQYIDGSLSVPNPYYVGETKGLDISGGVTMAFDVVPTGDVHTLGTILGFGDSGKLYFTPGSYLGYNATGGYFDANMKDYGLVTDYIGNAYAETNEAVHVELVFDNSGYDVYVNGALAYDETIQNTENGSGDLTNFKKILNWLQTSASKVYFGYGSWWNAAGFDEANILLSNVSFYANATSASVDVKTDYENFTKDSLVITSSNYMEVMDNPFYGKEPEELHVKYTINFSANAAKNGWDGIFAFYNSATGGRISFQTAPYICYNEGNGNWMDLNGAGSDTNVAPSLTNGTDYTFELVVTKDEVHFYLDGTEISTTITGSGVTNENLLEYIGECDQFTWGVGQAVSSYWWTELCTLFNIEVAVYTPSDVATPEEPEEPEETVSNSLGNVTVADNSLTVDEVVLATNDALFIMENPFYGDDVDELTVEYTINMSTEAAKNGWDGIFSFYETNGSGRISFQTAPYVCYNDWAGNWMDINQPGADGASDLAPSFESGTEHKVKITISASEMHMYVDENEISFSLAGSETAGFGTLLDFLSSCDGLSFGVGLATTSFWNTELCTIKDIAITIAQNEVATKNGSFEEDGVLKLYINDELISKEGVYEVNGTFYYVNDSGNVQTGLKYISSKYVSDTGLAEGYYHMRLDGSIMLDTGIVRYEESKNADGSINYSTKAYYMVDGFVKKNVGLVRFGDDFYYVTYDGSVYMNRFYAITKTNAFSGTIKAGKYYFGEDGKMHISIGTECFETNGTLYLLDNGMLLENKGLVKVDGKYYYSRYDGRAVINQTYTITKWYKDADTSITGKHHFGADGIMDK